MGNWLRGAVTGRYRKPCRYRFIRYYRSTIRRRNLQRYAATLPRKRVRFWASIACVRLDVDILETPDAVLHGLGPEDVSLNTYSHSIVAGGFPEMSYTTREIPGTSLTIR